MPLLYKQVREQNRAAAAEAEKRKERQRKAAEEKRKAAEARQRKSEVRRWRVRWGHHIALPRPLAAHGTGGGPACACAYWWILRKSSDYVGHAFAFSPEPASLSNRGAFFHAHSSTFHSCSAAGRPE